MSNFTNEAFEIGRGYSIYLDWAKQPTIKYIVLGPDKAGLREFTFTVDGVVVEARKGIYDLRATGEFMSPRSVITKTAKVAEVSITSDKGECLTWSYDFSTGFVSYPFSPKCK